MPLWLAPCVPKPMEVPGVDSYHSNLFSIVAGTMIKRDAYHPCVVRKKRGDRGNDQHVRRHRRCQKVLQNNDNRMYTCNGRKPGPGSKV